MALEELKTKIRWALEEAHYKGNVAALELVYAADYVLHRPPLPPVKGLEALKKNIAGVAAAYSEKSTVWHEWVVEGNTIVYRTTMKMKHTGQSPSLPIPPTGKVLTLESCTVAHVANGKVVEEYEYSDYLGFLQQLGIVPPLG